MTDLKNDKLKELMHPRQALIIFQDQQNFNDAMTEFKDIEIDYSSGLYG